jgi:LPXTG-motif cell wall-anchored protein
VQGTSFVVSGAGSLPGATVEVDLHSIPVLLGTTTVAPDGTFALTVTIPKDTAVGTHEVIATLDGTSASATVTITVAAAATATRGVLGFTGVDPGPWLLFALALLLLGAAGLFVARRRASRS